MVDSGSIFYDNSEWTTTTNGDVYRYVSMAPNSYDFTVIDDPFVSKNQWKGKKRPKYDKD